MGIAEVFGYDREGIILMTMGKIDLLKTISFGKRIAEEEIDQLQNYFVSTEHWRRVYENMVDVIYGPKGSGKSAIYSILSQKEDELFDRNILLTSAENPRGNTVFEGLSIDPPASEIEFIRLWKLYFIVITSSIFDDYGINNDKSKELKEILSESKLVPPQHGLKSILKTCLDYVRQFINIESVQPGVNLNEVTGTPSGVNFKITFREPNANEVKAGIKSIDYLYGILNESLKISNYSLWIVIDRLDVAFAEDIKLETNALRALFKTYRDLAPYNKIKLKIFLRDDIWNRITKEGFREASHITETLTINWDKDSILNLIISRLLNNEKFITFYSLTKMEVLSSLENQHKAFYCFFPKQIDLGEKKPSTLDWIISRVKDGKGIVAPREIWGKMEKMDTKVG